MKFERLEIFNFASYYGEHAINLTCTEEKPVLIFLGGTGYGKTSIFDALNWSLYGTDYEADLPQLRRGRNILDYVNETALSVAEQNKKHVEMSCTLYFKHEGTPYYINQSLAAKPTRNKDGALVASQTDRMSALYEIDGGGNHRKKEYNTIFLDEILPSNVKDYFLFDGDRIYNLTKPESSQEVRDAIYRVVDLELLQNAQTHLDQVATEYRRKAKREAKGQLGDVEAKYEAEHKRLAQLKAELHELRAEKQKIETQLNTIEAKLENLPDTSELQGRRSELDREQNRVQTEIDRAKALVRGLASTGGLKLANQPALTLITELDSRRQRGEIPKTVSQTLLKDLLKLKKCLCGTEFEENDQIYQALMNRLNAEQNKSGHQDLLNLLMSLKTASELISQADTQLREQEVELNRQIDYLKELGKAIDQVDAELEKLPKEDIAFLTKEARERRQAQVATEGKIQRTLSRIEDCDRKIKDYEKQRKELSKQQDKVKSLQLREHLADQAAKEIEKIYDVFAENSRKSVEKLTIQEFQHFVKSSSSYTVALSENYELVVLDSNGNRALQRLSMGQSQCLSLAFITAISRVSEKNPPLAIDMPFGRLDQHVHRDVSARLPELTSQLLLFLIPGVEWNDMTRSNLEHRASHIYQLEFSEDQRQTTIDEL
jgi:DNA sulfur modification protein DndD